MVKIDIKPLSVNLAWQGRRFKTKEYKSFEKELLLRLPVEKYTGKKFYVYLEFGFKNKMSDVDNPIKPVLDVIQKKYNINDRYIYHLEVVKTITKHQYIKFKIKDLTLKN